MVGITINNEHSYDDYGLILSSKIIEAPATKTNTVDIAGGNGVIDLTEAFGEPKFKNRKLEFEFNKVHQTNAEFIEDWSFIQNELNGKKVRIILDEEPNFYYIGRIKLSYTRSNVITNITMTVDAEPYKMKVNKTSVKIVGSGSVVLQNLRKKVVPTITVTAAQTKVTFGTRLFTLAVGKWVLPELELTAGSNTVSVESVGTTTFEYQEGGL